MISQAIFYICHIISKILIHANINTVHYLWKITFCNQPQVDIPGTAFFGIPASFSAMEVAAWFKHLTSDGEHWPL